MLGEFFTAPAAAIDADLVANGAEGRYATVSLKGLTSVELATLGEMLDLGDYDELFERLEAALQLPPDDDICGLNVLPEAYRRALATVDAPQLERATRAWARTDELVDADPDELVSIMSDVAALARTAEGNGQPLLYWWAI